MSKRNADPVERDTCGTLAGWNAHARNGERNCMPCKEAHTDYMRDWRHRTGRNSSKLYTDEEIAAIRAEVAAPVEALIAKAENRHGALYCHVTTFELRNALGMDVSDWPPIQQPQAENLEAVPTGAASVIQGEK